MQSLNLDSFNAKHRTVNDVCLASINQLKHLVLVFRTRYLCASSCFLWHIAMLYVANDCLTTQAALPRDEAIDNEGEMSDTNNDFATRTIWYMACIDGYKALALQFPILSGVVHGLLSTGVEKGLITEAEGRAYRDEIEMVSTQSSDTSNQRAEKRWTSSQSPSVSSPLKAWYRLLRHR